MDTEFAWVEAARAGDQQAFARIVDRFQKPIYSLAYRMLGNAHDAEDAAQETFLRAFRALEAYDRSRPFATWLLSVAAHLCIDRLRRRRLREVSLDALPAWRVCAQVVDPQREVERGERVETIGRLLASLPDDYRLVIVLRYWHDLGYDEIAAVTGDSESAVKSRLHRARRLLASALEAAEPGQHIIGGGDARRARAAASAGGLQPCSAMTPAS
jgi:RNA polymerase sigma-70 factor (ECF subfamily)